MDIYWKGTKREKAIAQTAKKSVTKKSNWCILEHGNKKNRKSRGLTEQRTIKQKRIVHPQM